MAAYFMKSWAFKKYLQDEMKKVRWDNITQHCDGYKMLNMIVAAVGIIITIVVRMVSSCERVHLHFFTLPLIQHM